MMQNSRHKNFWSSSNILFILLSLILISTTSANNCWSQRANLGQNDFVPECTDDGNFKQVQCDDKTGYCFCVDIITGRPNSQTTTKNRSLNCNPNQGFISQQDRQLRPIASSLSSAAPRLMSQKHRKRSNRRCTIGQRFQFINRLVASIQRNSNKKSRQNQQQEQQNYPFGIQFGIRRPSTSQQSSHEYNPFIQKFNEFDHDKDLRLSAGELKLLLNDLLADSDNEDSKLSSSSSSLPTSLSMIGCTNSMFDFCDNDHDQSIVRTEFLYCLNSHHTKLLNDDYLQQKRMYRKKSKSSKQQQFIKNKNRKPLPIISDDDEDNANHHSLSIYSSIPLNEDSSNPSSNKNNKNKKSESRLDCLLIRSNSIESIRQSNNPSGLVFIPECTADGHYVRVQCHMMHCWCVSRVTGQPIKPLNKNTTENLEACDLMRKGCDQRRRSKYHQQFRQRLNTLGFNCDSIYDQIDQMPSDHQIDDQEFQNFIKKWKPRLSINTRLHKCFRTEVHYCDQDEDGHLTRHEWRQCCNDNITVTNTLLMSSSSSSSSSNFNHNLFNTQQSSSNSRFVNRDSGLFPGSAYSSVVVEAYNQKKNRPRLGSNPLKILKSE